MALLTKACLPLLGCSDLAAVIKAASARPPTITDPVSATASLEEMIAALEGGPAEPQVADSQVADSQVADSQVSDSQVSESQVSESQVSESQVSDSQVSDSQIADLQVADLQPATDSPKVQKRAKSRKV
jgi:hypothetical protein